MASLSSFLFSNGKFTCLYTTWWLGIPIITEPFGNFCLIVDIIRRMASLLLFDFQIPLSLLDSVFGKARIPCFYFQPWPSMPLLFCLPSINSQARSFKKHLPSPKRPYVQFWFIQKPKGVTLVLIVTSPPPVFIVSIIST